MSDEHQHSSTQELDAIAQRLCNWGRWGPDDELGTLNHITPEKVVAAASLVRRGEVVELGVPLESGGPQTGTSNAARFNPLHFMTQLPTDPAMEGEISVADDVVVMPLQASTQWDALAHVGHKGLLYGGRPVTQVTTAGASVNDIRAASGKVISRGVLADVAGHLGVESMEAGQGISGSDLDAVLGRQGVAADEGDMLLVRTGYLGKCRAAQWAGWRAGMPGLDLSALEWLHDHRIAAVATDTPAVEVMPSRLPGIKIPFHVVAIVYMGLLLGEIFELDGLAATCARHHTYEFLFVAAPLPVTGAVGSPLNPYAVL